MSRVHDSVFFLPSPGGDTWLVGAEYAVRTHYRAVRRHISRDDRVRAHGGAAADAHRAEHFRARADEDVIFNHCKIAAVFPGNDRVLSAYGHLVHDRHATAELDAALDDDTRGHRHQQRRAQPTLESAAEQDTGEPADH